MDEIVGYVVRASDIARTRAENFTAPLIFSNLEGFKSNYGEVMFDDDYLPDEIWSDKYKTNKRFETFAKYFI